MDFEQGKTYQFTYEYYKGSTLKKTVLVFDVKKIAKKHILAVNRRKQEFKIMFDSRMASNATAIKPIRSNSNEAIYKELCRRYNIKAKDYAALWEQAKNNVDTFETLLETEQFKLPPPVKIRENKTNKNEDAKDEETKGTSLSVKSSFISVLNMKLAKGYLTQTDYDNLTQTMRKDLYDAWMGIAEMRKARAIENEDFVQEAIRYAQKFK